MSCRKQRSSADDAETAYAWLGKQPDCRICLEHADDVLLEARQCGSTGSSGHSLLGASSRLPRPAAARRILKTNEKRTTIMMRSHYCGQLNESLDGQEITLAVGFTVAVTTVG